MFGPFFVLHTCMMVARSWILAWWWLGGLVVYGEVIKMYPSRHTDSWLRRCGPLAIQYYLYYYVFAVRKAWKWRWLHIATLIFFIKEHCLLYQVNFACKWGLGEKWRLYYIIRDLAFRRCPPTNTKLNKPFCGGDKKLEKSTSRKARLSRFAKVRIDKIGQGKSSNPRKSGLLGEGKSMHHHHWVGNKLDEAVFRLHTTIIQTFR